MQGVALNPSQALSFRPSRNVVGTRTLGTVILLDLATDQYMTLTDVAARMWELMAGGLDAEAAVDRLCDEYQASREDVRADLAVQLEEWTRRGLIEPAVAEAENDRPASVIRVERPARVSVPSVLTCVLAIMLAKGALRIARFGGTIAWLRRMAAVRHLSHAVARQTVLDVAWSVAVAGAIYPGRAKCLEQSLVLYYLLRRRGVAATYCHGVHPLPFQAHAWVEYEGEPVNDVVEHTRRYALFPGLLP